MAGKKKKKLCKTRKPQPYSKLHDLNTALHSMSQSLSKKHTNVCINFLKLNKRIAEEILTENNYPRNIWKKYLPIDCETRSPRVTFNTNPMIYEYFGDDIAISDGKSYIPSEIAKIAAIADTALKEKNSHKTFSLGYTLFKLLENTDFIFKKSREQSKKGKRKREKKRGLKSQFFLRLCNEFQEEGIIFNTKSVMSEFQDNDIEEKNLVIKSPIIIKAIGSGRNALPIKILKVTPSIHVIELEIEEKKIKLQGNQIRSLISRAKKQQKEVSKKKM